MGAQRKQIGPELVMQLARDLLALDVLERDRTLGEAPLFLHRLAQGRRKVVQPGTDRRQFGRARRLHARIIAARTSISVIARDSASSGANARPTTVIVIRNSATAIAEPTSSWVTMPSQISLISSSGCDVITSACGLPWIVIGTLTDGLFRMNQGHEPRRRRANVLVVIRMAGLRHDPGRPILPRDADMAQPAQILDNLVQPRFGVRRLVQAGDDGLDEFARQPDHALVFGLDPRRRLDHQPRDIDGETERQDERQQQVDPGAQG